MITLLIIFFLNTYNIMPSSNSRGIKKSKKNIFNYLKNRELGKKKLMRNVNKRFWLKGPVYNHTTVNNKKKMGVLGMAAIRPRPKFKKTLKNKK